ncbi:methyltransferase family protein [Dongia mobilis]|uniref:Methyltransferase family protein n=1 Tax=Dongia mobilis TaxID=578943 RepID=A0A4R6WW26_9PROT|nr:class I SAM-dependent methyltransferase [Dongia mobilis]TDQ84244.1 methyltransferase family protein [Dongia mobilis]
MTPIPGTDGYAREADRLAVQYESFTFEALHRPIFPFFPPQPRHVLDIGAGTGRDAAGFAAMGDHVLAVEPVAEMRAHAVRLHPSPLIEWLDDSLPDLARVRARGKTFDIVMLTAVLMHFDAGERGSILANVAELIAPGGILALSLRHGPTPPGRRMFPVDDDNIRALGEALGLETKLMLAGKKDKFQRDEVTWSRLVFGRGF